MKTLLNINTEQKISYCIPTQLRDEQIKINIKKVSGRLEREEGMKNEPIAIVCFGPSLRDQLDTLRSFKNIMTCSGAHKFLIENGIVPTYHLDLDPRLHKITMLGEPNHETQYLIASTVHPKYFDNLVGYNVKLWHIFATDDDADRVLPKGEWALTGGSSVGLRCISMARFMGYTDLHIFGMDGCISDNGTHATEHPNAPPIDKFETEYNGKMYATTPSILYCATETFKELNQLPDVRAKFYGEGLVQEIAKDYKPNYIKDIPIAFNRPELISKSKIELDKQLHHDNPNYGMGGAKHKQAVLDLCKQLGTYKVLDYGAGKGQLAKSLDFPIWQYDPAVDEIKEVPKPADIVVCTDVLEHIEIDKLKLNLMDLARCVLQVGYFVISTRKAVKTYADGRNTHSIVKDRDWWEKHLRKYFNIAQIVEKKEAAELHVFVKPRVKNQEDINIIEVSEDGLKGKFYAPNAITKWRAETLFSKEPSTIEWIKGMQKGEVLFDVGANVGGYSILAGVKGLKVYAFEPEADNYALLIKNMILNGLEPNAYPVAISDNPTAGVLYQGQKGAGGACNSFGEEVGPDLQPRRSAQKQGCIAMTLDSFLTLGIPEPDHLKIDVDGFEDKVIKGASKILANGLKSLLIEINPALEGHNKIVEYLQMNGFEFDPEQVERATRKEGNFKGCAEYVFYKKKATPLIKHIVRRIEQTEMKTEPFKYLYVEGVFTDNIYERILANLPRDEEYTPIEKSRNLKGYPERFTGMLKKYTQVIGDQLLNGEFKRAILKKFGLEDSPYYSEDILLIRDLPGYSIPPHTDTPAKLFSVLFYLPENDSMQEEGTGIYVPHNKDFKSTDGKHLDFNAFEQVDLARFKPNSCLIFQRTDNSFHGVPPCSHVRNVLLYNIRNNTPQKTTTTNE